ncbi:hypothetical protein [Vibrio cyclitrophicus]|uniref:hypothetical protein n=1 Tax=Vibrio gigantis TaxID=296199 RepID=UPI00354F7BEE
MTKKKAANSGVVALSGYEFQRNCALFLLLDNYDSFKDKDYFLCIEHYDDFLFCYRTADSTQVEKIEAYQAKKKTGALWTIDSAMGEVLGKMLEAGHDLKNDPIPKSPDYVQELTFISNTEQDYFYNPKKAEVEQGKTAQKVLISEANELIKFDELPLDIQEKTCNYIQCFYEKYDLDDHQDGLCDVRFQFIELQKTPRRQKEALYGLMQNKFPHIVDSKAAVDVILELFRNVEYTYNQGNDVQLMDASKRVEGHEIGNTLVILDEKQKTYDFWRDFSADISKQVSFPIKVVLKPEQHISDTFELLKDMNNFSYQVIKSYVKTHDYMSKGTLGEMFNDYLIDIKKSHHTNLSDADILLAILCSFVEHYC